MTLLKCWAFLSSSQGTNGPRAEAGRERGLCTPMTSQGSDQKESACKAGDLESIPGLGRSPRGGHGNPLQYSCQENPHGLRSLVGYCSWGCKESNMTETKHMTPIAVEQKFSAGSTGPFLGSVLLSRGSAGRGSTPAQKAGKLLQSACCKCQVPSLGLVRIRLGHSYFPRSRDDELLSLEDGQAGTPSPVGQGPTFSMRPGDGWVRAPRDLARRVLFSVSLWDSDFAILS